MFPNGVTTSFVRTVPMTVTPGVGLVEKIVWSIRTMYDRIGEVCPAGGVGFGDPGATRKPSTFSVALPVVGADHVICSRISRAPPAREASTFAGMAGVTALCSPLTGTVDSILNEAIWGVCPDALPAMQARAKTGVKMLEQVRSGNTGTSLL
jgi:hypothetical protein